MGTITPEIYQAIVRYHALRLEVRTGLRHSRGSVMKLIKESYGITGHTKVKVLENYKQYLLEKGYIISE